MKGIATITVRGADGKIKERRTEHNTVTTAYLEKMKQALKFQKFDNTLPSTGSDDFKGIWLHSEQLANLVDMEPVVLCGGTDARNSGVSQDYSVATKSQVSGNDISSAWVWVLEKDINIKAISLHNRTLFSGANGVFTRHAILFGTKKAFTDSNYRANSRDYYRFDGRNNIEPVTMSDFRKRLTHEGRSNNYAIPLYRTDEFFLSSTTPSASDATLNMQGECKIVDETLAQVRTFTVSQFAGLSNETTYDCAVMPTAVADWLFVFKSTTEVAVYKIPRSASADTIPLVTTVTGTSLQTTTSLVISNCIIFNSTSNSKTMFSAHSDGTYSIETGVQIINGTFAVSGAYLRYYLLNSEDNPTPVIEFAIGGYDYTYDDPTEVSFRFSPFPHNTILNLSSPIEAVTGDTLTISYTVTVDEGAEA